MIISQDILRKDTIALMRQVDVQIEEVRKTAEELGVPPEKMRDSSGNWVMSPLLMAKAQIMNTLVLLNQPRKK